MDILSGLNKPQQEAVLSAEGPLLVLAGPGSGKTRVITHRVAHLINDCGVSSRNILAITFTNKAANEMKTRLRTLVGTSGSGLTIGTFHAFAARVLRADGQSIGVEPHFVIFDSSDQERIAKSAIEIEGLDPKKYRPGTLLSIISQAKGQLISTELFAERVGGYTDRLILKVYRRYQHLLEENQALDFDDLLLKAVELFRSNPDVLAKYQDKYMYILVDEFQDTNPSQYELVHLLAKKNRNICVVGDPDQSIYSWRSADPRNVQRFLDDYPDAKKVVLGQNYRSTKNILEVARSVISGNHSKKELWTENEAGEPIVIVQGYNETEEAGLISKEIIRLVSSGVVRFRDCAIMYRTNAQSRVLEEALLRSGLPYKLANGTRFYERSEVKDIISYIRVLYNQMDNASLLRIINVPPRGIGQITLGRLVDSAGSLGMSFYEAIKEAVGSNDFGFTPKVRRLLADFSELMDGLISLSQETNLLDLFDQLVERIGYEEYLSGHADGDERWDNILELRTVIQEYGDLPAIEGMESFLERSALVSDIDGYDENADAITLITLHQAKGLEFPVVFIAGVEEGLLPHARSFDDPAQLEEERRLFYVGITRAKRKLYLTYTRQRSIMSSSLSAIPSRYLSDIPEELVSHGITETAPASPSEKLLDIKPGDKVRHQQFGDGLVISCEPKKGDAELLIAFRGIGMKRLLLSLAKLEKVE
jgi:DNA helicase-2/ATP-dependent DNA helicase PcrA